MRVAVIGAGICGLYLGWKLSENGLNVTIFEKRSKIGKEACSGLFSERIFDFIPQSEKLIENQIEYCLIHFPKKTIKIKFSKKFLVMDHFELDNLTAKLAQKSGVKIVLNNEISKENLPLLQNDFEKILGCDGPNSIVRKNLGFKNPNLRLAVQGFTAEKDFSSSVETWATKNGFIWRIPRGKETEYGIMEKPKLAKTLFEEFIARKKICLKKINSALVPEGLAVSKNAKFALCGDAAGLTKPWSGGGVIWGLTAADILLKNFPDFLKYQKEFKKFFMPRIFFSKIATKTAYFLGFNFPWLLPGRVTIESDFLK